MRSHLTHCHIALGKHKCANNGHRMMVISLCAHNDHMMMAIAQGKLNIRLQLKFQKTLCVLLYLFKIKLWTWCFYIKCEAPLFFYFNKLKKEIVLTSNQCFWPHVNRKVTQSMKYKTVVYLVPLLLEVVTAPQGNNGEINILSGDRLRSCFQQ